MLRSTYPCLLCYSSEKCGIQFEIYSFWYNIKCSEVFQECKTFQGAFHVTQTEEETEKEEREKVEDVSRRQLSWISWNSYDLFLSITAFAAGIATQPSTKIAGLLVQI